MAQDGAGGAMPWPDLMLLTRGGWQLPMYGGIVSHLGTTLPKWMPPTCPFVGGHGSVDTLPIIAAIHAPGARPARPDRPIRIADLAVTAAGAFGLQLQSTTLGVDLAEDLR